MSYYRIHHRDQIDALTGGGHESLPWQAGSMRIACRTCGHRYMSYSHPADPCPSCGEGDQLVRSGWSVCRRVSDLCRYFDGRDPDLDGAVLVEVEGEPTGDYDHDAGTPGDPVLVDVTAVVSVTNVPDEIAELDPWL